MIGLFGFLIGSIFGSFLNVCITRIPISKSVIFPPSICPKCNWRIKFYNNIPVVSYLFLKGKCENCKQKIPVRYLIVEVITGYVTYLLVNKFGISLQFLHFAVFTYLMIVITFIDIENNIIFNKHVFKGILLGISFGFIFFDTLINRFSGIFVGSGTILLIALIGNLIYRRESMGGGDIKYAAMIGSFVGVNGVVVAVIIAILSGAVIGLILKIINKTHYIPFAPFLSFGAISYIFNSQYFNNVLGM